MDPSAPEYKYPGHTNNNNFIAVDRTYNTQPEVSTPCPCFIAKVAKYTYQLLIILDIQCLDKIPILSISPMFTSFRSQW